MWSPERGFTMPERAVLLAPGFLVADAEYPCFSLGDGCVGLDFVEASGRRVRVAFTNVAGLKWQEIDVAGPEPRGDSTYEILESDWLKAYFDQGARSPADDLHHFKLCFNAQGTFEVLALSLSMQEVE
jgi:hypothetical protein